MTEYVDVTQYYRPYGTETDMPFTALPENVTAAKGGVHGPYLAILLIVIVVVLAYYYYYARNETKPGDKTGDKTGGKTGGSEGFEAAGPLTGQALAARLAAKGWVLYSMQGCGYCTKQLAVMGVAAYPKQVHCSGGKPIAGSNVTEAQGTKRCSEIPGFPHWVNPVTGDSKGGMQSLAVLQSWAA